MDRWNQGDSVPFSALTLLTFKQLVEYHYASQMFLMGVKGLYEVLQAVRWLFYSSFVVTDLRIIGRVTAFPYERKEDRYGYSLEGWGIMSKLFMRP